ncbi:MAG: alcohol acetyltransferase [Clostridia bacterium]
MNSWYKLDNAAKVFPAVTKVTNSSVYRVSAILTMDVDKEILQEALNQIYEKFPMFFVRMRKGFFWNYLDSNHERFLVKEETDYPCKYINKYQNKGYFLKVLYYKNRISIEIFHSITDGNGAVELLKSLLNQYFYLLGKIKSKKDDIDYTDISEDSFNKYYEKTNKKKIKLNNSYRIKGKFFEDFGTNVITGTINITNIKRIAKSNRTTITGYLISLLIYSIYKTKAKKTNKPIVVTVPVNLRKKFPSNTLRNFFCTVNVGMKVNENTTLEEIIKKITKQLQEQTTIHNLEKIISNNVNLEKIMALRIVPLYIKNFFVSYGFNSRGETKKTITMSNIGRINLDEDIKKYIRHMDTILYPTIKSPISCGVCSVNDTLSISFSRSIIQKEIIKYFFKYLANRDNLDVAIYSNNWGEDYE